MYMYDTCSALRRFAACDFRDLRSVDKAFEIVKL